MATSWVWRNLSIAAVLSLVSLSAQQTTGDPLHPCQHWLHQTCIIDSKLYIDGGLLYYGSSFDNQTAEPNTALIYEDLTVDSDSGFPTQYDNLTKGPDVPTVSAGTLWADEVNKIFYLYGGNYINKPPDSFSLWSFDTLANQWSLRNADSSQASILRAASGGSAVVQDRGWAYYYGGYINQTNVPGWAGDAMMLNTLIQYDMVANTWTNNTGFDETPRAEGVLLYIPASDRGMLVYFGGVSQTSNGTEQFEPMQNIHLYDIASQKTYMQTAGGSIPRNRRGFCAGATWAEDYSSYNIYLYGGFDEKGGAFDEAYILTVPSFEWILAYPNATSDARNGKGYLSCNVYEMAQMLVIGGLYSNETNTQCDSPNLGGQHNMNLGKEDAADALWYQFLPNVTSYNVPAPITAAVGGGPTGGATMRAPSTGFDDADLSVYFTRSYSTSRTATRSVPATGTASSSSTPGSSSTDVGAIAGGVVGGVVGLVLVIALVIWGLRRRQNRKKQAGVKSGASDEDPHDPQLSELRHSPMKAMHLSPQGSPPGQSATSFGALNQHSPVQQNASGTNWSPVPMYQPGLTQPAGPALPQHQQTYFPPPPQALQEIPEARAELSGVATPVFPLGELDGGTVKK